WGALSSITNSMLYAVYFTSTNTGVAVGGGGAVLRTTNGGGEPVGIAQKPPSFSTLKIYPNPASQMIAISDSDQSEFAGEATVTILNLFGESVKKECFNNLHRMEMDVRTLVKGIYMVKLQTGTGTQFAKLLIN
ncbi:MAG: T9SS type A sorting domain-containing protein, partial [Bacteroidota bacterium]